MLPPLGFLLFCLSAVLNLLMADPLETNSSFVERPKYHITLKASNLQVDARCFVKPYQIKYLASFPKGLEGAKEK